MTQRWAGNLVPSRSSFFDVQTRVLLRAEALPWTRDRRVLWFALGRVEDRRAAETAGTVKTDAFVGVGPGYRTVNTPDPNWRVQAGVGLSYMKDGPGASETDTGYHCLDASLAWLSKGRHTHGKAVVPQPRADLGTVLPRCPSTNATRCFC